MSNSFDEVNSMTNSLSGIKPAQDQNTEPSRNKIYQNNSFQKPLVEHFASKYYTEKEFIAMGNIVSFVV